eukprot:TRINITY_DN16527_c0_g1_i1.p1 TRINITY_DN16527_c0_g1~~TRINITY_DN16527_c0_g1_i1.p1  ORF type:complete len:307 (+),score=32.20 TRINITY_DN16527_c0_g1_i1:93-1013(+)
MCIRDRSQPDSSHRVTSAPDAHTHTVPEAATQTHKATALTERATPKDATPRLRIAHVVALYRGSAPKFAAEQQLTIESMRRAARRSTNVSVELCCTMLQIEQVPTPEGFRRLAYLNRSTTTLYKQLQPPRNLPFLADILWRLHDSIDAEYLIYTNADIALQAHFYAFVASTIADGYDAFVINRRDIPETVDNKRLADASNIDLAYKQRGRPHPGWDCFVFKRSLFPELNLGLVFLGFPPVGAVLSGELNRVAHRYKEFKEEHVTFHLGYATDWQRNVKGHQRYRGQNHANSLKSARQLGSSKLRLR